MNYYLLLSVSLCFISWTSRGASSPGQFIDNDDNQNKTAEEKGDEDSFGDDRINLSWGSAKAKATDSRGRYSEAQTKTWSKTTGIKNIHTGTHISLGSKSGSSSKSYSSGKGGPKTWASSKSAVGQNSGKGSATAGFSGGKGTAHAKSHSKTQTYNLGGGNVLYSNLNTKKKINGSQPSSTPTNPPNEYKLENSENNEKTNDEEKSVEDSIDSSTQSTDRKIQSEDSGTLVSN